MSEHEREPTSPAALVVAGSTLLQPHPGEAMWGFHVDHNRILSRIRRVRIGARARRPGRSTTDAAETSRIERPLSAAGIGERTKRAWPSPCVEHGLIIPASRSHA